MPVDAAALLSDWAGRFAGTSAPKDRPWLSALFGKQREFVELAAKRKTALCGRRSGKTWGVAAWLLDGGEDYPNELSAYIALTRNSARGILWRALQEMDRELSVGLRFREIDGQLMVQMANGHMIWLVGCKDQAQAEKFRGYKFVRVAIDETGSFPPWLKYLIEDVLDPTLIDFDGEIALVGTPPFTPAGYFHDVTTGQGDLPAWPTVHWTVLDNPHIKDPSGWLRRKREREGWDETHPTYRREWLGEWVRDDEARVYPYDGARNACWQLPESTVRVLAVDLGHEDASAFVECETRPGSPEVYISRAWKRSGMTTTHAVAYVHQLRSERKYQRVIVDEGGLGKMIAEDWRRIHGLPVERAEKKAKLTAIHNLRGMLLSGQIKVHPVDARPLIEEWQLLPWNEDRDDHHPHFLDDCADAALYAVRALYVDYRPEEEEPKPGTREALNLRAEREKRDFIAEMRRERQQANGGRKTRRR